MDHVQISFDNIPPERAEVLIAVLSNAGFTGFEEELMSLKAFIPLPYFNQGVLERLVEIDDVKYSKSIINEINWNEKWESDFEPVQVFNPVNHEPFAYIRADFHPPAVSFLHDLIITPKMSFGTGHHATTYLMVSQMSRLNFNNKAIIDFGTGTGVLAVLADKMGASSVLAIDNDDWSINNAKENLGLNHCAKVNVVKEEAIPADVKADIILANINLNVIIANLQAVKCACHAQTQVLFSGIMTDDEKQILNEIQKAGMIVTDTYRRENWLAISAVNK